jgi:hypothetical protein
LALVGAALSLFLYFSDSPWFVRSRDSPPFVPSSESEDQRIRTLLSDEAKERFGDRYGDHFRFKPKPPFGPMGIQLVSAQAGFDTPIKHCMVTKRGGWCGAKNAVRQVVKHHNLGARPGQLEDGDWIRLAEFAVEGQILATDRTWWHMQAHMNGSVKDTGHFAPTTWVSKLTDLMRSTSGSPIEVSPPRVERYANNGISVVAITGTYHRVWGRGPIVAFIRQVQVDVWPTNEVHIREWTLWEHKE